MKGKVNLNIKERKKIPSQQKEHMDKNHEKHQSQISPQSMLKWTNYARTKPQQFANLIQKQLDLFIDDKYTMKNGIKIQALEGKPAFTEAIEFCKKQKPLPALILSQNLCKAAKDHTIDMIQNNFFGHTGSDGSKPSERLKKVYGQKIIGRTGENCDRPKQFEGPDFAKSTVIRYIVDEAVPSRGHRTNIYNPQFKYMGAFMKKDPANQGYKNTFSFCSINLDLKAQKNTDKNKTEIKKPNQDKKSNNITVQPQKKINQSSPDQISAHEILKWINIARTKPQQIANIISEQMKNFIEDKLINKNGIQVRALEGRSAYQQAINFCQKQDPLQPLQLNQCLNRAAAKHTKDMIKNNIFGHTGTDGSSMSKRISQQYGGIVHGMTGENCDQPRDFQGPNFAKSTILRYIIDEAVPSRGHRHNIYNRQFKYMGACMLKDQKNKGYKNTLDFCSIQLIKQVSVAQKQKSITPQIKKQTGQKQKVYTSGNHSLDTDIIDGLKKKKLTTVEVEVKKKKQSKNITSTSTKTQTVTKNGIKQTTVTKKIIYDDGTQETIVTKS